MYRRLETLPETKGRFRLNAVLPIAFDATATPEVDLLCEDARVAVELDGPQHLADPVAYRRDRSKDRLLQQNGYFVLRFLADDVGKELDLVLDSVLRTVAGRRSCRVTAKVGRKIYNKQLVVSFDGDVFFEASRSRRDGP